MSLAEQVKRLRNDLRRLEDEVDRLSGKVEELLEFSEIEVTGFAQDDEDWDEDDPEY